MLIDKKMKSLKDKYYGEKPKKANLLDKQKEEAKPEKAKVEKKSKKSKKK